MNSKLCLSILFFLSLSLIACSTSSDNLTGEARAWNNANVLMNLNGEQRTVPIGGNTIVSFPPVQYLYEITNVFFDGTGVKLSINGWLTPVMPAGTTVTTKDGIEITVVFIDSEGSAKVSVNGQLSNMLPVGETYTGTTSLQHHCRAEVLKISR